MLDLTEIIQMYPFYSMAAAAVMGFYLGFWKGFKTRKNERAEKIKAGKIKAKAKRVGKKMLKIFFILCALIGFGVLFVIFV